jgi:hypothetical protein
MNNFAGQLVTARTGKTRPCSLLPAGYGLGMEKIVKSEFSEG